VLTKDVAREVHTHDVTIDSYLTNPEQLSASQFPSSALFVETSTKWMEISPADLDDILAQRQEEMSAFEQASDDISETDPKKLKDGLNVLDSMVKEMESFMTKSSGLEGVENKVYVQLS